MQGYVPGQDEAFAESRKCFGELEDWLASEEAAGLQHGELEEQLDVRGRELLRQLFQDRLDLMAAREERRHDVTGAGRRRAHARGERPEPAAGDEVRAGHGVADRLPVAGQAERAPAGRGAEPAGGEALARAAQARRDRGGARLDRGGGRRDHPRDRREIGKRQLEELVRRAAAHVDAFYLWRVIRPAPDGHALVLTFDGKGIVMLPDALRPATAKAAAAAESKLATRLSPGEKNGRKRMAELACVYDAVPVPRTPEDVISTPAQKTKEERKRRPRKGKEKPREPQAKGKWLTASVTDDIPAVIAAAFGEAERRDPQHQREWAVLVDGNNTQIEAVTAEAARRGVTVTIVIDFIHVLEYLWKAAWSFFDKGEPAAEEWVADQARKILHGKPARSRPGSAAAPPPTATPPPSAPAPTNAPATWTTRRPTSDYATALKKGWPIATGIIEGACTPHRQGQNGHNGRKMGTRRRRGHPQAPRPHRQRRLRRLLALPPPPRARTHPPREIPRRLHPRSVTSSPQKSRTQHRSPRLEGIRNVLQEDQAPDLR